MTDKNRAQKRAQGSEGPGAMTWKAVSISLQMPGWRRPGRGSRRNIRYQLRSMELRAGESWTLYFPKMVTSKMSEGTIVATIRR